VQMSFTTATLAYRARISTISKNRATQAKLSVLQMHTVPVVGGCCNIMMDKCLLYETPLQTQDRTHRCGSARRLAACQFIAADSTVESETFQEMTDRPATLPVSPAWRQARFCAFLRALLLLPGA